MKMGEFNPRNPHSRPNTPPTTAWFEFLLREGMLEEHLSQPNPDPSAATLIATFLTQADTAVNLAREVVKEQFTQGNEVMLDAEQEAILASVNPKKARALRLLALKVAAHLKWNLDILHDKVPFPLVHAVLQELLRVSTSADKYETPHSQLDISSLPDQTIFALQLYHCWCVRTVIDDSFPTKPTKTSNVQVPGLLDVNASIGFKEPVLKMVKENLQNTIIVLENLSKFSREIRVPTMATFSMLTETSDEAIHDWTSGTLVSSRELKCQICNSLGCIYFLSEDYTKAKAMFQETQTLLSQLRSRDFCVVDTERLKGYCSACGIEQEQDTVFSRLQDAMSNNVQNVVDILLEDNQKHELSLSYRLSLYDQLAAANKSDRSLLFRVETCNAIRCLHEDVTPSPNYLHSLYTTTKPLLDFVCQACDSGINSNSFTAKSSVKSFARYLCQRMGTKPDIQKKLIKYLSPAEVTDLKQLQDSVQDNPNINLPKPPSSEDPVVMHGSQEEELRNSYNPTNIRKLVKQLLTRFNKFQVLQLSDKWWIPREVHGSLESISSVQDRAVIHILIAKARICVQLQMYDKGRGLLVAADGIIKDTSYTMSTLIRWEILNIEITQFLATGSSNLPLQDISKRTKTCITSLQLEQGGRRELQPRAEILASCVVFLLSTRDWDYLINLSGVGGKNGNIQLARMIATLCKELPMIKSARKPARELWEAVLQMFTSSQQQKRTSTGLSTVVQRDSHMGLMPQQQFINFTTNIKDPTVLSALVSCLTKLYNILKDDITCEISSDYVILWPTTVPSASSINVSGVADAVDAMLTHALKVNPAQPSWLRTQADIHYAHNQYSQALQIYIQAGSVVTEFFSDVPPKTIFDDTVYKRMIRCSSYLQCHTQVAVLCQFLDETDYTTAFKSLQERNCHDAMDTYYECFWDSTLLEYLINLHAKRGEVTKKQQAMKLIGQLELNSSNPTEILIEAAKMRKTKFLRAMAKQYL